jgi:hypothetical protein
MDDKMMLSCQQTIDVNKEKVDWGRVSIKQEPHGLVFYMPFLEEFRPAKPQVKNHENGSLEVVDDEYFCSPLCGYMEQIFDDSMWNVGG